MPYFRVDQILVGIEDGYRAAETGPVLRERADRAH